MSYTDVTPKEELQETIAAQRKQIADQQSQIANKDELIKQLVEGCQGGVLAMNELLNQVQPILKMAGLPPIPPPPFDGIKEIIRKAGGVVYESVKDYHSALAAAKEKE